MNNYKYKFSVIMPIYNAEKYLAEAIDSVINQTIGFKDNIQLILVNDGSKDNSEKIALKYKEQYPENIIYIKQENKGVSSARNKGAEYIEGEYVNFLDSDDKWDVEAFEKVYDFFKKNDVNIVAGNMNFLEEQKILNQNFLRTKIIDILEDYNYILQYIEPIFIKTELSKKYKFDVSLKYEGDSKYINEIILNERIYGFVEEISCFNMIEIDIEQKGIDDLSYYTETIKKYYNYLTKLSIQLYGNIIPYIQYLLTNDIKCMMKEDNTNILSEEQINNYIEELSKILKNVEDYIIVEQRQMPSELKIFMLSLKYQRDITKELYYKKGKLYFNNLAIFNIRNNRSIFKILILEIESDILHIEGTVNIPLKEEDYNIYTKCGDKEKELLNLENGKKSIFYKSSTALGVNILNHYTYKLDIPLKGTKNIRFIISYKNIENRLTPKFGKFAKLSNDIIESYSKGKYFLLFENKKIKVLKNKKKRRLKKTLINTKMLIKKKKFNVLMIRALYKICNKFNKKEIWLISDRENKANDNGEHFFRYVVNCENNNIKPYFVISKDSEDYYKMCEIGNVIKANTLKHKIYFLMASKVISSQVNDYALNIFRDDEIYYRDLLSFKFVFLQHGITKDDISRWVKKFTKNIKIFVTAGIPEYESIISSGSYYTENEVKLTGFPRYDNLIKIAKEKEQEKKILIIPTWRKSIKGSYNEKTESVYLDTFKDTEYFKFYNGIINDKRILDVLKEKGYKIKLCLHPAHYKQWIDFEGNEYVEINHGFVDYQNEFASSALLVTDYSSVFFDMAYLRRPVIYSQFDEKEFFAGHTYEKGYFDYEKDGFGPVCRNYEETVKTIVNAIKNDCKIEKKYLDRIDKFYKYNDGNNCKRVYDEIIKL